MEPPGAEPHAGWCGRGDRRNPVTSTRLWKVNSEKADPTMRWQNWKLHAPHRARGEVELYDLSTELGERHNLASQKPDLVRDLTTRLKAWIDTLPKTYEHGDVKEN